MIMLWLGAAFSRTMMILAPAKRMTVFPCLAAQPVRAVVLANVAKLATPYVATMMLVRARSFVSTKTVRRQSSLAMMKTASWIHPWTSNTLNHRPQ